MSPGEAAVTAGPAVDLMVEGDRRSTKSPEQRRWAVGQRKSTLRDQYSGRVVPAVRRRDQGDVAEIAATCAQPACFQLGTDRAELFAQPSIHRRGRDRVHGRPSNASVLERYRHKKRSDAGAP